MAGSLHAGEVEYHPRDRRVGCDGRCRFGGDLVRVLGGEPYAAEPMRLGVRAQPEAKRGPSVLRGLVLEVGWLIGHALSFEVPGAGEPRPAPGASRRSWPCGR